MPRLSQWPSTWTFVLVQRFIHWAFLSSAVRATSLRSELSNAKNTSDQRLLAFKSSSDLRAKTSSSVSGTGGGGGCGGGGGGGGGGAGVVGGGGGGGGARPVVFFAQPERATAIAPARRKDAET